MVYRVLIYLLLLVPTAIHGQEWTKLEYDPDQPGLEYNPLKGFMTLWNPGNNFPHSIQGHLFGLDEVMTGMNSFNWTKIESALHSDAMQGNFSYIQVNIDPANGTTQMPEFLINQVDWEIHPDDMVPDWNNEILMQAMLNFIEAYGEKYNDDPRVYLVHFGLYGMWGEWHVGDYKTFEMTGENQARLSDAYLNAFPDKQLLARYPTMPDNQIVGFSDGMFFGQSIGENSWYFHNRLKDGDADRNWELHSIGGEIQPDLQKDIWKEWPNSVGQDVTACVDSIHPSWLISHHVLTAIIKGTSEWDHAIRAQKMMAYTLYINKYRLTAQEGILNVEVGIENKGIAPMYADWDVEIAVLDAENQFQLLQTEKWKLKNILPGDKDYYRAITADSLLVDGTYKVMLRIVNPLEKISSNAKPVRFANTTQDADLEGWITLGEMTVSEGICGEVPIRTEGLTLNHNSISLTVGETSQLTAVVAPADASNKDITWVSDHPLTASVDSSGKITAGPVSGHVMVYAYTQDGGHVAEVKVNVEPLWKILPGKIEAEDYVSQYGIQTENTADIGGGLNVGWIEDNDWLEYAVNNTSDSIYFEASFRLSAPGNGGHIFIYLDENEIGELFVPNTGSWQNWRSVVAKLKIEKGEHSFRVVANKGYFNINYIEFEFGPEVDDYVRQTSVSKHLSQSIQIYPVPSINKLTINSGDFEFNRVNIIDISGRVIYHNLSDYQSVMNLSFDLNAGTYIIQLIGRQKIISKKIIIDN